MLSNSQRKLNLSCSTLVEYAPHHLKVEGSCTATASGTRADKEGKRLTYKISQCVCYGLQFLLNTMLLGLPQGGLDSKTQQTHNVWKKGQITQYASVFSYCQSLSLDWTKHTSLLHNSFITITVEYRAPRISTI